MKKARPARVANATASAEGDKEVPAMSMPPCSETKTLRLSLRKSISLESRGANLRSQPSEVASQCSPVAEITASDRLCSCT